MILMEESPAVHGHAHAGAHFAPHLRGELRQLPTLARELLAGGVAGGLAKTSVAPLERVKILYQTGRLQGSGVFPTLKQILHEEGALALYRGNGASVLRIVPYAAIHFTAYESYRKAIVHIGAEARASKPVSPVIDLLAGSAAGATAVLITYPLDLVRTRLAFQTESGNHSSQVKNSLMTDRQSSSSTAGSSLKIAVTQNPKVQQLLQLRSSNSSIRGIIQTIFREEGVLGLYRGIGPTLAGILPYAGLKFYVYQSLKQYYWAQKSDTPAASVENVVNSPQRLPVPVMLTFGAGAGLVAQTLTYPLDVVRRRMQVQGVKLPPSQQNLKQYMQNQTVLRSTWHGLVTILQTQGAKALFAGLSINYMKVVPSTAIGFTLYDSLKSYLDLANNL